MSSRRNAGRSTRGVAAWRWGLACGLVLARVEAGELSSAESTGLKAERPLQVWVYPETLEAYTLSFDNAVTAMVDSAKPGKSLFSLEGVLFEVTAQHRLNVATDCQALHLRAAECSRWKATVPAGNQAYVKIVPGEGQVELVAPLANTRAIRVRLCDDAWAEIEPASTLFFEMMADETYYFVSGTGTIHGYTADGEPFELGTGTPPVIGGPLIDTPGADGIPSWERRSPATRVQLSGDPGSKVKILIAGNTFELDGSSPQEVRLPNGSLLELGLDLGQSAVVWKVKKGYFEFTLEGDDQRIVTAVTGQSGTQQWNPGTLASAVKNVTPPQDSRPGSFWVRVGGQAYAKVGPSATLQTSLLEGLDLISTAAAGGEVILFNPVTAERTDVTQRNTVIVRGALTAGGLGTFFEAAGAGRQSATPTPQGSPIGGASGLTSSATDVSRIPQPPVSTVR